MVFETIDRSSNLLRGTMNIKKQLEKDKQETDKLIRKSIGHIEYMKGYYAGWKERNHIENLSKEEKLSWARKTLFKLAYSKKTKL